MLLRLQKGLPPPDLDRILRLCKELGYRARQIGGREDLLELAGTPAPEHRSRLEDLAGVREVLDAEPGVERHSRAPGEPDTVVRVQDAAFGGGSIALIAGPCAVEDRERTLEIARGVRRRGATLLRGGAYKPRTSPYSFQGLGGEALDILREVRAETSLGIVTEVLDPREVEAVSAVADMLQIGARSMTNFPLLREVGRATRPVLLKRGFAATVRELLLAAEYVLAGGNEAVVLCERGIRSFDDATRNVLDVGAVAHLKRVTHLPVIVDPSHAAGRAELVRALSRAGLAAGADGLLVEVHPSPGEARSDGEQAVSLEEFGSIVEDARAIGALDGRSVCAPGAERERAEAGWKREWEEGRRPA